MKNDYKVLKILSTGLVGMYHTKFGQQLWSQCKLRKHTTCIVTGQKLKPGDMAFSPITNLGNRMLRISREGIYLLAKDGT